MKIVITGAGVSGLTLAERILSENPGYHVTVLERENAPGGLARSFHRDGFDFDIGPHRFHTANSEVDEYLRDILKGCYEEIQRNSSVYMAGKYRNWPLTLQSVLGLPLPVLWRSFLDLFRKPDIPEIRSFADFIRSRYGNNLYRFFFAGYTRKFTGLDSEELHVDWAQAGVNRAVIDKRVKADNLVSLLKSMLLPKPVETTFYYPSKGGIQTFCDIQTERIREAGGRVLTGVSAEGIVTENGRVTAVKAEGGKVFEADTVYWTAPISILFPEADLRYINTLIACVALNEKNPVNNYQWCYFGQKEVIFSRLTVPAMFRRDCVPPERDSLIAEITCSPDSEEWKMPEKLEKRLLDDLKKVNAIKGDDVLFVDWYRIPETYPIYSLNYRKKLAELQIPEGLIPMGRCGSFWYNNMDHSIHQALTTVSGGQFSRDFWKQG